MRALELGEKALALVPQANQAQLNRSGHIHHVHHMHENLHHMRQRYLQRVVDDSYSSDEDIDMPMEEQMDFEEDLNGTFITRVFQSD